MIFDRSGNEGEEFLLYSYPSNLSQISSLLSLKGVLCVLESGSATMSGQKLSYSTFDNDNNNIQCHIVSDALFEMSSIGIGMILISWDQTIEESSIRFDQCSIQ